MTEESAVPATANSIEGEPPATGATPPPLPEFIERVQPWSAPLPPVTRPSTAMEDGPELPPTPADFAMYARQPPAVSVVIHPVEDGRIRRVIWAVVALVAIGALAAAAYLYLDSSAEEDARSTASTVVVASGSPLRPAF